MIRLKRAVLLALVDYGFDHVLADTFDCSETEADVAVMVDTELHETFIDIRSEYGNLHALTFVHEAREFIDIRTVAGKDSGHVFGGIVGLEPGGLEGNPRIACGVALIEGIGCEFLPVLPYFVEHFRVMAVRL